MRADAPDWRALAVRLGIGVAIAAGVVVLGRVVGLAVAPFPAVLAGMAVAAASWAFAHLGESPVAPPWQQPQPESTTSRFNADVRTRRLATMLSHAQPGKVFEAGAVARLLADLTSRRLVRRRLVPADDPLAHADGHLSPALLAYLRAADADRPPTLTRRVLHAHLKEIDEL